LDFSALVEADGKILTQNYYLHAAYGILEKKLETSTVPLRNPKKRSNGINKKEDVQNAGTN